MFDTHCHLNFKRFKDNYEEVIEEAKDIGVKGFVIPGTDLKTSKKAIAIAEKHENVFAAVGTHPHHAMTGIIPNDLFNNLKVVAVGEVGIDRHVYENTKYADYHVNEKFIDVQKDLLKKQIRLAIKYNKSLILHNREAAKDILEILKSNWDKRLKRRTVFHCCEPDKDILEFARKNSVYIGIDGDVTYEKEKERFIKEVPLDLLVLETDSPFLLPEPLRSKRLYPNVPSNIPIIVDFVAKIKAIDRKDLVDKTTQNAKKLFNL